MLRNFGIQLMRARKRNSINIIIPITLVAENANITVAVDMTQIRKEDTVSLSYNLRDRTTEKIIAGKISIIELFL